ncbi:pyridoxal phosphate-dependent aminotransferase [Henriciella litoralis]|uniref:pyridoxal phosphate-dependent aminotransferase n=1 Tax=Henriciella litoralis TaxID=568102 RepID=UPI0009FC060C|nr:pyridoxal phosphate-dependent aminotransferase [Henriciella litoralis]
MDQYSESEQAEWFSYAHWVRDALALMRSGTPGKIGLFESSVPEPTAMLASTIANSFRLGPPSSYQSVFMRSNPVIVEHLAERYQVPAETIHCTTGATSGVSLIYRSLLTKGHMALIEKPGFDIFTNCAHDADIESHFFERQGPDFAISVEAVIASLKPRTKMVVISDLHNPSGKSTGKETLERLAEALDERGIFLLIDEVYSDYCEVFEGRIDPHKHSNVLRVSSLTKTFGLSTLRCGWIIAHPDLLKPIRVRAEMADFSVSKLSHSVAAQVLLEHEQYDGWRRGHMEAARPMTEAALKAMQDDGLIDISLPLEGCICFPRVVGVEDTNALSKWLISNHGVVVVPGECFGQAGYVRIGYALNEATLAEALKRLAAGLAEYRAIMEKRAKIA